MKYVVMFLTYLVFTTGVHTQDKATTRAQMQHKYNTRFLSQHLKQTEESLLKALQDTSISMQTSAMQTIRELEQIFTEYPFASLLVPLEYKLKDENADSVVRMLAAIALDGLHSDAGDDVIGDVAKSCEDKGVQTLCKALLVKGGLYK
jgi:hypothetical protein